MPGQELLRAAVPVILVTSQLRWFREINATVPEPYLDEVFHVPQAQAFAEGRWSHWDDKITTPPGTYVYSIAAGWLSKLRSEESALTTYDLRWTNVVLMYMILAATTLWSRIARRSHAGDVVLQREYCITAFPLLFFFSGLYYTDVFSALTVLFAMVFWQLSVQVESSVGKFVSQLMHLLFGLVSLTARQTNIFWVAVFLGGLQLVESVKRETRIHDPPVADAHFEDFPTTIISLLTSALPMLPRLILDLWPQLALLASFVAFVAWNGGVVLGDKTSHVATIHLPQLLYIWPFLVFFSWPVMLPQLSKMTPLSQKLPRAWLVCGMVILAVAIVHLNTIVHPFLLADNRHYMFYVFKILRTHPWLYYALAPIYIVCGWLSILALGSKKSFSGGVPSGEQPRKRRLSTSSGKGDTKWQEEDTIRISFVLVWLASTALSLVTAPLVEPRYFIMPWLIWRLHVPDIQESGQGSPAASAPGSQSTLSPKNVLKLLAMWSLWIEFAWYMAINAVTAHMFLHRGFSWPSEPGKVQRFMW